MRARHTEPDRDGDILQGLHVALVCCGALAFSGWFFIALFQRV